MGEMSVTQPRDRPNTTPALDDFVVRLLVIHDEGVPRPPLLSRLSTAGFAVQTVLLGVPALKSVHEWNPDAILLDVVRPRDGFGLIPMLRRLTQAPIIMLSAKEAASETAAALMQGADDYITRPFDMQELLARVHSTLRRPHLAVAEVLRFADLIVDPARRIVLRSNRSIELSKREFDLLLMLIRNQSRILTRSELLDSVWGTAANVTSAMVDTYISYLRAKIDAGYNRKLILTVRGVGYTLRDNGQ
jgi:DNA-binding response OmpR family regulator